MESKSKQITAFCVVGDGVLFKAGDVIELSSLPDIEMQQEDDELREIGHFEGEIKFKTKITTRGWLAILGMPTSNNWRKMHGGVMDRNCGKRKRRKKQNE